MQLVTLVFGIMRTYRNGMKLRAKEKEAAKTLDADSNSSQTAEVNEEQDKSEVVEAEGVTVEVNVKEVEPTGQLKELLDESRSQVMRSILPLLLSYFYLFL